MTFLYLCSDRMGNGDDGLGRRLLQAFLGRSWRSPACPSTWWAA
jgi:hypothetical protein